MRLDVSSSVAVNRNGRRSFGTTRWIDERRVSFSTHAEVEPGEHLELRYALEGLYDSVCAEVEVDRATRPSVGGPLICDARLVYLPAADRRLLDDWLAERSASISRSPNRSTFMLAYATKTGPAKRNASIPTTKYHRTRW